MAPALAPCGANARQQDEHEHQAERPADDTQQNPDRVHIQEKKKSGPDRARRRLTPRRTGCTDRKTDQRIDEVSAMLRHPQR